MSRQAATHAATLSAHVISLHPVGYYWMLGRIATVFQVDLDVAQGT